MEKMSILGFGKQQNLANFVTVSNFFMEHQCPPRAWGFQTYMPKHQKIILDILCKAGLLEQQIQVLNLFSRRSGRELGRGGGGSADVMRSS